MSIRQTKPKIVVATPDQQHSLRLANALNEEGILYKYMTTVYDGNSTCMRIIKVFVSKDNRKRIANHKSDVLADAQVSQLCELSGLICTFLGRYDRNRKLYDVWRNRTVEIFGRQVAEFAIRNRVDAVIMYDTVASSCFEILEREAPNVKRILDVSAANHLYMNEVYSRDMEISPDFAGKLESEIGIWYKPEIIRMIEKELEVTQYFLVPSEFVKNSLLYSGIDEERIYTCPYGVDLEKFGFREKRIKETHKPVEFVFVGGTKQLKGFSYLAEAFMGLKTSEANLTVIGNNSLPESIERRYEGRINFIGFVLHDKLPKVLEEMDVLVFPSLGEGMSLSVIEAMASGLPVIVSENSGVDVLIEEGENGFVVPIQNSEMIRQKMKWFVDNRHRIPEMGLRSHEMVRNFTWESYGKRVAMCIKGICELKEND
jgi:glycosyltransferase involved in cell wall biosynthesis